MVYFFAGCLVLVLVLGARAAWRAARRSRTFDSAGVRLRYTREGHGPPVILVHGFAADAFVNWRLPGIIRVLRRQFDVIALDVRGHGRSEKPISTDAYGQEMTEDIVRLMDHLGIERAHLVGYSMGGFIALDFINRHPERLVAACIGGAGWIPEGEYPSIVRTLPASLDAGTGYLPILSYFAASNGLATRAGLRIADAAIRGYNNTKAMARCFESLANLSGTEEQLRTSPIPVLSFVGTRDPLRVSVENMVGKTTYHEVLFVKGGDHTTSLAWPPYCRQCTEAIVKWLVAHPPEKPAE